MAGGAERLAYLLTAGIVSACFVLASTSAGLERARELGGPLPFRVSGAALAEDLGGAGGAAPALDGGVRLYENASLAYRLDIAADAVIPVYLEARGTAVEGVPPYLTFRVDRELVQGIFVPSREWGLYRVDLPLRAGSHHVQLGFVNDKQRFPANRDLDLRSLSFGAAPDGPVRHRWTAPCALRPAAMASRVYGEAVGSEYRLWNHGRVEDWIFFPEAGTQTLRIVTAGAEQRDPGRISVRIDGKLAGSFDSSTATASVPLGEAELEQGLHRVSISYEADDRACATCEVALREIVVGDAVASPTERPLTLWTSTVAVIARDFDTGTGGKVIDGRWVFWSEGHVERRLTIPRPGPWTIDVLAWAELCGEQLPRLLVMADRDQLALHAIDSPGPRRYSVDADLEAGEHRVALAFLNDLSIPGVCDRNVHIESVVFRPRDDSLVAVDGRTP